MSQGSTRGIPIDTDAALAADSDQLVASQKATKAHVAAAVSNFSGTLGTAASRNVGTSASNVPDITAADARYAALASPSFISYSGGTQTTTSTSLADVHSSAGWTFASTGLHEFEIRVAHTSAATTTGSLFSLSGTATQSYLNGIVLYPTLTTDRSTNQFGAFDGGAACVSTVVASPSAVNCAMRASVNITATGTLLLRFATEVGGSAISVSNVLGYLRKLN